MIQFIVGFLAGMLAIIVLSGLLRGDDDDKNYD